MNARKEERDEKMERRSRRRGREEMIRNSYHC
jgi:hypothetical protein